MRKLVTFSICMAIAFFAFSQAPTNDSCQNAKVITFSSTLQIDTFKISTATSDLTGCGLNPDVWYKFAIPSSGGISISTKALGTNYNQYIRLYQGSCGSFTPYSCTGTCNYYSSGSSNCWDNILLKDPSIFGDTVYLRVSNRFSGSDVFGSIRYEHILDAKFPANDTCGGAVDITASAFAGADTFTLQNALVETNITSCGDDQDIWVKFEVPASGGFNLKTKDFNGGYNQYFRVYEGGCASLTPYDCNGTCDYYSATSNCSDYLRVINPNVAGDTFWVKISTRFSFEALDSFSIDLEEIPTSAFIPNDSCGAAIDITANAISGIDTFTLENSIVEGNSFTSCGNDEDIWVKFAVPSSGGFEITTKDFNGGYNQFFTIYEGSSCASLAPYACTGTCNYYSATNCYDYLRVIDTSLIGDSIWVRITNRFNFELRDSFSIDIITIPTIDFVANDKCQTAVDFSANLTQADTFTLKNAQIETTLQACGDEEDVWFKFEVPSSGAFEIETQDLNGGYNQFFTIYTGSCASPALYNCANGNCDGNQTNNCGDFLRVIDPSLAGDTVWVRASVRFDFELRDNFILTTKGFNTSELKTNDDCGNARILDVSQGNCSIDTFDNINTTYSTVPTSTCGAYNGADVWFKFEMPSSDDVFINMEQVDITASDFRITAFTGGCASMVERQCNGTGNYPDLSLRNLGLAGDTVWLHVYKSFNSEVGDTFGLCIRDTVLPSLRTTVGQYEKNTACQSISGNGWFDMVDSTGNLVMSVDPTGSYLGPVCFGISISDSANSPQTVTDTLGNTAFLAPRHFYINPANKSSSAIIRLYFKERELQIWRDSLSAQGVSVGPSLAAFYQDSMRISKTDGSSLNSFLGANPTQINPTVTKIRDSIIMAEFSVTSFSNFIPMFNPGNVSIPVPVEWLSFTGTKRNGLVSLNWATASELNCSHFEVQQSWDGHLFDVIGIEVGNGNVGSISRYTHTHRNTSSRKVYYRLKQIDYDGNYDYSKVVAIAAENSITVSPNPFKNALDISAGTDEILSLELTDLFGRTIYMRDINNAEARINLTNEIDHGVYILRIITESGVIEKKVIKE